MVGLSSKYRSFLLHYLYMKCYITILRVIKVELANDSNSLQSSLVTCIYIFQHCVQKEENARQPQYHLFIVVKK